MFCQNLRSRFGIERYAYTQTNSVCMHVCMYVCVCHSVCVLRVCVAYKTITVVVTE